MRSSLPPTDRLIFEGAHDAILIFDPETEVVLDANQRAAHIYGLSLDELLGMSLKDISDDVPQGEARIAETLAADEPVEFETVQRRGDGSEMLLEVHASVVELEGRRAILTINRDITERRAAEHLRAEKEAAVHAAQATRELLAFFSHEIRNPLMCVVGLGDLLRREQLEERQRQMVETLFDASNALVETLDDVLDLSRLDAGHAEFRPESVDPRRLLSQTVELIRPSAEAVGLRLETEVDGSVPERALVDASSLRRVLLNLIGNSVKYTPEGRIDVRLSVEPAGQVQTDGPRLVFHVRDTGIGIETSRLEEIFEPFQRAPETLGFAGAGLGLAICRRLADAMGGSLAADSAPGEGSTFALSIPLVVDGATSAVRGRDADRDDGVASAADRPLHEGLPILIVEDNPINRLVLVEQLRFLGYGSVAVESGEEACELARERRFALVLLDCELPGIDGFETARCLRRPEMAGPDVPILALSAHPSALIESRCMEAGMDDTLSKPFTPEELRSLLERHGSRESRVAEPVA